MEISGLRSGDAPSKRVRASERPIARREQHEDSGSAPQTVALDLVAVLDEIDMALSYADDSPLAAGIRQTRRRLVDVIEGLGARVFGRRGERFDPHMHEAVAHEPDDELSSGMVIRVQRVGVALGDQVMRPASVIVAS